MTVRRALTILAYVFLFAAGADYERGRIKADIQDDLEARYGLQQAQALMAGADPTPAPVTATVTYPAWMPESVTRWAPLFEESAQKYQTEPVLLAIVSLVESGGGVGALSGMGATGIMQVMPKTARDIDAERGVPHDPSLIAVPEINVDYGAYNLWWCLKTYGVPGEEEPWTQSIIKACRCYNGGPTAVAGGKHESNKHAQWVAGMWQERNDATSPTYEAWLNAGGSRLVAASE